MKAKDGRVIPSRRVEEIRQYRDQLAAIVTAAGKPSTADDNALADRIQALLAMSAGS